ncbi:hypothetical protein [Streptomyces hydrogenans]|uniref:hypothetical protein n=1 Tax=Streptomyces hydrogenans TaxID=1873719 RepID=UPI0034268BA7
MTARLNRIAAAGTGTDYRRVRFADGCMITVEAGPDAVEFTEVATWPGLTVPRTEAWQHEDAVDLFLTCQDVEGGRLFLDVPVTAVRELIEEHGGEHADQDADLPPVRHTFGPRAAASYPVFLSGQQIGQVTRHDEYWTVPSHAEHGRILEFDDIDEAATHLVHEADIAAGRTTRPVPEPTPPSAEQALRGELAVHGVTPHRDEEVFIGGDRTSWLVVGLADGAFPDMEQEPYLLVLMQDPTDGDEVSVDRPVRAVNRWSTVIGTGDPTETTHRDIPGGSFPGRATAALAAYIAQWRRNPFAVRSAAIARLTQR